MPGPDILTAPDHFDVYAAGVDYDLAALGKSNCRAIRSSAAGVLAVKRASDGATVLLPYAAGETQVFQATHVLATGTTIVGSLTIYW